VAPHEENEFDADACKEKHKAIGDRIGSVNQKFGFLALFIFCFGGGAIGWAINDARNAQATADQALRACEVQQAREGEFRKSLERQLDKMDSWMQSVSRKQDEMNATLTRLAAKEPGR